MGNPALLEKGSIYFLYRPKVESPGENRRVESLDDVERTYLVLSPEGKSLYRRMVIGRKKLPETAEGSRYWGFVDEVAARPEPIREELAGQRYQTKTRGERKLPAARVAGEGIYAIVNHGDHTHLEYALELPVEPGEPQSEMNIESEASYIMAVKNPEQGSPKLRGRRFLPVDPGSLDHAGAEFVLIGTARRPADELGLDPQRECRDERCANVLRDLRLSPDEHPLEPLLHGGWK